MTSKTIMDKIEQEGKLVGGVQNVFLGGVSQGAQETLGTAIHLKDRFNTSIAGVIGLIGPVPLPPNGEQALLHKTPMLVYLGADDHLYDPELLRFGYEYDEIISPNFKYFV
jgi:predicted esterase